MQNSASTVRGSVQGAVQGCGKCHATMLRVDFSVLERTAGRLLRLSCARCGWDLHLRSVGVRLSDASPVSTS